MGYWGFSESVGFHSVFKTVSTFVGHTLKSQPANEQTKKKTKQQKKVLLNFFVLFSVVISPDRNILIT